MDINRIRTFLFVPADRPERISKALESGSEAVIVDLEDAIAPDAKIAARATLSAWLDFVSFSASCPVFVRVNSSDTPWHADDLTLCRRPTVQGVVLPKAESAEALSHVHSATNKLVLPIIESAKGLQQLTQIAGAPGCARLVFGKLDLAVDLALEQDDADKDEQMFLPYRAQLVLASRLAALPPPVDGVYTALNDDEGLTAHTRRARRDGFGAVLLIHPCQVPTATAAFVPSDAETAWARRVITVATEAGGGVAVVDGRMVDAPVIARATRVIEASEK